MGWFVYVLECRDGTLYTGVAVDVQARFAQHAAGKGARYTRAHPPRRVLASFECANRSEAQKHEAAIKRMSAAQKRELCLAGRSATSVRGEPVEPHATASPHTTLSASTRETRSG